LLVAKKLLTAKLHSGYVKELVSEIFAIMICDLCWGKNWQCLGLWGMWEKLWEPLVQRIPFITGYQGHTKRSI